MRTKIILALLAVGALCAVQPAQAHHAFAAEYDVEKPVTLTGTLTKMEWVNPHGWIYLDVKQPDGTVKQWTVEASGPSQMSRRGLKKTDFVHGMPLTVKGYQGKKDPVLANGRTLVLADGRSFYIGSVGGPNDGADK
jgi:DNA/RNA endonuclease YhcR with UshA esterase domain